MTERQQAEQRLVDVLVERQQADGLSDQQMAARLGISKALWVMTRSNQRKVGMSLIEGAARTYPEYVGEIVAFFVRRKVTIGTSLVPQSTEEN